VRRWHPLLLGLCVILVACHPVSPPPEPPGPEAGLPTPDIPLVVYERTGGPAGLHERWEIYPGGQIVSDKGIERFVPPETLMSLMEQVERVGFFDMEDVYLPDDSPRDYYAYALSVQTQGAMKTVVTADNAPGQPPELLQLLEQIDGLVRGQT